MLLLFACHGADPEWDLYPLMSYALADLPTPRLVFQRTPSELTVVPEGDLPCPIPLSGSVRGQAGAERMVLRPGSIHGTGLGSACIPSLLAIPRDRVPPGPLGVEITDGNTTWEVTLADPLAERRLVVRGSVVAGAPLEVALTPTTDRWVETPPGRDPTRLVLAAVTPGASCRSEAEEVVGPIPSGDLIFAVPADFCPGPAYLTLSTSLRRSAVLACPAGVPCHFDPGGFAASVEVKSP